MPANRPRRAASVALALAVLVLLVPAGAAPAGRSSVVAAEPTVATATRPPKREPRRVVSYHPGRAFTTDTDLVSESGLAGWAIDEYLAAHTHLPRLGSAFRRAERRYGVNAIYLVAHAMLESRFGSSDIARYKRNLFGFNAYDRGPYRWATRFRTYRQGIDVVARFLRERYLSPDGRFWRGYPTLIGVNRYYASDRRWAEKVAGLANEIARETRTLGERGIRFAAPRVVARPVAGASVRVDLRWSAHRGSVLPAGLRFAVRWVPVAVVESDRAVPSNVSLRSAGAWRMVRELPARGHTVRLEVATPALPGIWRLEVQARDADGSSLPGTDDPAIRALVLRVGGARGAGLAIAEDAAGRLQATVANTGRVAIPARGPVGPTSVEAWALPVDPAAPAVLLVREPLRGDLAPGARRTLRVPAPAGRAVVVVRLAGDEAAAGRGVPVAALVDPAAAEGSRVLVLAVGDPRSDALLHRRARAAELELVADDAPGTLGVEFAVPARATRHSGEESTRAPAAPAGRVILRTVAASGPASPSLDVVNAPLSAMAGERLGIVVDGIPGGVRLVVAWVEPVETGAVDAAAIRLAWLPVGASPAVQAPR